MADQILLMTRPLKDAQRFVARLDMTALVGVAVVYAPLLEIVQTAPPPSLAGSDGVIFTSANGVGAAAEGDGTAAYCVGARTARCAVDKGYDVRLTEQDADHLVAQMHQQPKGQKLVHICGHHRRGDIATRLQQNGISVDVVPVYDQRLIPLSSETMQALDGEVPVTLPLFSPRTAAHFTSQVAAAHGTTALALSLAVAAKLDLGRFAKVMTSARPTGAAMVEGIEKLLCGNRLS